MLEKSSRPQNFEELNAQDKIEAIRGKLENYSTRIQNTAESALPNLVTADEQNKQRVMDAFKLRIESYFASPSGGMNGGDRLAHLSQIGVRLTDEVGQEKLERAAAALAAEFMKEAGFKERADNTYADLGRMVANDFTK